MFPYFQCPVHVHVCLETFPCVCEEISSTFHRGMLDSKMCVKLEMVFHCKGLLELPLRCIALDLIVAAHVHQFRKKSADMCVCI